MAELSLAAQIAEAAAGKDTTANTAVTINRGESLKTKSGSGHRR